MKGLFYGLVLVGIYFIASWLWHIFKAADNPDVKAASALQMSVTRYRYYQSLYDEFDQVIKEHGSSSPYIDEYFQKHIFPKIKNMNEWRRYQKFRFVQGRDE